MFGPYTFGTPGASFVFKQALNETGSDLGILTVTGYGNISFIGSAIGGSFYPTNLGRYASIGASNEFGIQAGDRGDLAWAGSTGESQFNEPGQSYLGFRFDVGKGSQYGWAELEMLGNPENRALFKRYGWENPGFDASAGNLFNTPNCVILPIHRIPESGAISFLALGAVGLMSWRKKRRV